ncbi:MAG: cysteine-rich KTR domain-containing protein [Clostridia bacterium]|nr:cysteine-rich KTR domain-containing protein [Clostridia bacterium]
MEKESLWVRCPICDNKTRVKVFEDTVLINFPLYCPWCKRETIINVVKLKMVPSKEPDA